MNNKLLGFSFYTEDYADLINKLISFVANNQNCFIITPTTEILYASYKDPFLSKILSEADILLPDSITLVKLAAIFKKNIVKRITGIDLMFYLGNNNKKKFKVFYLGAKQSVIEKAVRQSVEVLPDFEVVGYTNGFFSEEEENNIIKKINSSGADILFVGTGFPKQEVFIHKYNQDLLVPIKITVGGSFDVIAGVLKRAPKWMQKMGLEWLFRLIQEPARIKRMSLIPFELVQLYFYEKRNGK